MATPHSSNRNLVSDVLVGLSAMPVLLVVLGEKALRRTLIDLGQTSEEIFRGDRLPILWMPADAEDKQDIHTEVENSL